MCSKQNKHMFYVHVMTAYSDLEKDSSHLKCLFSVPGSDDSLSWFHMLISLPTATTSLDSSMTGLLPLRHTGNLTRSPLIGRHTTRRQ